MRQSIQPQTVAKSSAFASPAVRVDNTIYISGQVSRDKEGRAVGVGDPRMQFETCIENIRLILEEAGSSLSDVVKLNLYVVDWGLVAKIKDLREKYFAGIAPATTGMEVSALMGPEYLMEIDVVAYIEK